MDKHLDAIGYLLAALVFLVGFLSNRMHSRLDATVATVSDGSWRVRQALREGVRLGPADVAEVLSVVHSATDYVMIASRVLNWGIFATVCFVFGDAVGLRIDGAQAPDHEMFVIGLLFAASLGVVVFSEFDVRRVELEQRREVAASTLGRLEQLATLVEAGEVRPGRPRGALNSLKETFPSWGLLIELDAYLDLRDAEAEAGLAKIEELVASGAALYLSPVVGTACCVRLKEAEMALSLLGRMQERDEALPHLTALKRALAIRAAHLSDLLARSTPAAGVSQPQQNAMDHVAQDLVGRELEMGQHAVKDLALDLEPAAVAETALLMKTLSWWEADGNPPKPNSLGALSPLVDHVLARRAEPGSLAESLLAEARSSHDPATLESLGLVSLACNEPRTALRCLESAIRLQPASARSHWGRAIACHKLGWRDAAMTSLRRAATLSDDTPLISYTEHLFDDGEVHLSESEIGNFYPGGVGPLDKFELALLGVTVPLDDDGSVRGKFARALVSLALSQTPAASA